MSVWEMFLKGGVVMYPLAFCSVIGLMIILERIWCFWRARINSSRFIDKVTDLLSRGNFEDILQLSEATKGPLAEVIGAGVREYKAESTLEEITHAIERTGSGKLQNLGTNLTILNTIANVSPLLGLLGTVAGMVKCFMQIGKLGGRVDVSLLASGIWEAMLTTVFGLSIAIPCLLFHSYFISKIDQLEIRIKETSEDLIAAVKKEMKNGV